jgi:HEAT repeat protein
MKTHVIKVAAVLALLAPAVTPSIALAGKGGNAAAIAAAIASTSKDAIIAELERTESLICDECIRLVTDLTEDSRYEVREVAAWWFARRPALRDMLAPQFSDDLAHGDPTKVRNAADFLGATKSYTALPQLRSAIHRGDLSSDAKIALVRAARTIAHVHGNEVLTTALADGDPQVRLAAVMAWSDVLDQKSAQPIVGLLADSDADVRGYAASTIGNMREQGGRGALEQLVVADPDSSVRRSAAWALGRLGNAASRPALVHATADANALVRGAAKAALTYLH